MSTTSEIEITSLAHGGRGVGRIEGQVCFVPYALPGDRLQVTINNEHKGILWANIAEVLEASPHRTESACDVFGRCGGCTWLHFAYPAQAEWKQRIVRDCFERIAGAEIETAWAEDADLRLGYRTRATFHGELNARGFYAGGSRDVVAIGACPLCHPKLNAALQRLSETKVRGSVELVVNPEGDEVFAWAKRPNAALKEAFPATGSVDDSRPRDQFLLDGAPIVNGAFAQSSLLLNRQLRSVVQAALTDSEQVLDLYCGTGNFSLGLGDDVAVLGLDHNQAAIDAAMALERGAYMQAEEKEFKQALADHNWEAVILDPPRVGAKEVAPAVAKSGAQTVVYVSCDPATLARDAKAFLKADWHIDRCAVVDMFPHTAHIETVCCFKR